MVYHFYNKKFILFLCILLQVSKPATIFSANVLWPSEMNLYDERFDIDNFISTTSTASNSKKGFTLTGDPKEIFTLGAGHIGVNVTLSGKSHQFIQMLTSLKRHGVKITIVLVNDKAPVGLNTKKAPKDYQNPYFYMIDFSAENGDWQKYNFKRIVDDYGKIADNWIIGNEINSQLYNYYGPSKVEDYTKVYCDNFKIMYDAIKEINEDANIFISFDQCFDMPAYRMNQKQQTELSLYRYNMKDQLDIIDKYLGANIDWGVSLHPYPSPVESAKFWDDEYAGFDEETEKQKDRPYLLTAKNLEVGINYVNLKKYFYKNLYPRKFIISEVAFTSHDGEEIQAAGLYYLWKKVEKYDQIIAFIYNSQTDLPDGYNFGLVDENGEHRLIWALFKDMDRDNERMWCDHLLKRILDKAGFIEFNNILFDKASYSEILK